MRGLIGRVYHNGLTSRIFHTLVFCLNRELKGCQSVLDLGCGPDSPLKYCQVNYSVGVDAFEPYIKESKGRKIHNKHVLGDITRLDFKPKSFDAVIMIGVLEHLKKKKGRKLLERMERWARKKVIVSMPNGYLPQRDVDKNPFQAHRSGWEPKEMKKRGYKAYGMAGWRFLRGDDDLAEMDQYSESPLVSIRFRPRAFWFVISALTQIVTYYIPSCAFEEFYVRELTK